MLTRDVPALSHRRCRACREQHRGQRDIHARRAGKHEQRRHFDLRRVLYGHSPDTAIPFIHGRNTQSSFSSSSVGAGDSTSLLNPMLSLGVGMLRRETGFTITFPRLRLSKVRSEPRAFVCVCSLFPVASTARAAEIAQREKTSAAVASELGACEGQCYS